MSKHNSYVVAGLTLVWTLTLSVGLSQKMLAQDSRAVQSPVRDQRTIHSTFYPRIRIAQTQTSSQIPDPQNIAAQNSALDFRSIPPNATGPFSQSQVSNFKTVATRLKGFGIPFQLNAGNSFIEVQLYMSRDMGQTWQFQGRQSTDRKEFPFEAEEDGEYWFAIKTLNRDRRLLPDGAPQPELKIVVDTIKPTLDFQVETDAAGRVICRWLAKDKHIVPETMQIFYQPVDENAPQQQWVKVPIELKGSARNGIYSDQLGWWPETSQRKLNVAAQISDVSGNKVEQYRQILVSPSTWRHRQASTARVTDPPKNNKPIRNPWVQPESIPAPTVPRTDKTTKHETPPNVICEGGICRIVSKPKSDAATHPDKQDRSGRIAKVQSPPNVISPPIGELGFGAPPAPGNYTGPERQFQTAQSRPDSIEWQSETESWGPKNRSSFGTTRGPLDPALAPGPGNLVRRKPVTSVPSNPPTMQFQGNEVVGQSSTKGLTNQYRGLNSNPNSTTPDQPAEVTFAPAAKSGEYPGTQMQAIAKRPPANPVANNNWALPTGNSNQPISQIGFSNTRQPRGPTSSQNSDRTSVMEPNAVGMSTKAPTQIIGNTRFRLNYGIDSIDPSGVAKVDLWMTRDDGRTWNVWGSDPDNESPFPVEVKEEGKYGFRVVVHSRDGLTGQGPSSGDDADMWILVDTTAPLARITSVPYGRGQEAGRLIVNYAVSDAFLTVRPVTLLFATNPSGPWIPIEEGGRNAGRFVWKPTPQVPDRIFLRIEAVDKAGNVGAHTLSQAIDVSGLVPRGTIHGVVPVGR